ncbi:MAG: hypothetical protein ACK559_34650 [bacterium]
MLLMLRYSIVALGLVLWVLLALLPVTSGPGLVVPRQLRLSCPFWSFKDFCRS